MAENTPKGVKLEIDGVEYMVTENFKEAYEKNLAAERAAAREAGAASVKPTPTPASSSDDDDDGGFILTKDDIKKMKQEMREELKRDIGGELSAKQNEQQLYQRFWDKFGKGLDRAKHEIVVNAVFAKNQDELTKLAEEKGTDDALQELSKRVKDVINIETVTRDSGKETKQVLLEGAPQTNLQVGEGEEDEGSGFASIGEVLKSRKAARRKAAMGR